MRSALFATASILTLTLAGQALAAPAEDAAYDRNKSTVIDSRGNCVRTQWQDKNDPCAPYVPTPVAKPAPKAIMPVISTEARTIYFDFNRATLTSEATTKLDELAKVINESTAITNVTIHGFTDQFGTDSYNNALAQKRVDVAKAYLDSKSRLKTEGDIKGLGKSAPEAACTDIKKRDAKIACMAKERRVEVEFNVEK